MKQLVKTYNRIENFFFKGKNDYEFLVFFRVSIGLFILLHFLSIIKDFERFFSSKSIIPLDIMEINTSPFVITLSDIVYQASHIGIEEHTVLLLFKLLFILLGVFIILGFYSRISAFLLLFLHISLVKTGAFFVYGVDFFTSMSLFYLIFFPSDSSFSLRKYFFGVKEINPTPIKRMFQLHLSIAYFFSGFGKALGFNWWNGESIWKAINLPYANSDFNINFDFMAEYPYIPIVIGWVTIIIELFYPLFIWIKKTQRIWLFLTISMHIGIAIVLNLYYFATIMILWNLTNFHFENRKQYLNMYNRPSFQSKFLCFLPNYMTKNNINT